MNRIRFILVLVGTLLLINLYAVTINPGVVVKTDKNKTVIGGLITLVIEVKGAGIKYVSWNLCDTAVTNIEKINVLQTASSGDVIKSFKHTIIFTSSKPGDILINHLPIVIHYLKGDYVIYTNRNIIKFKNEPLLTSINDINSIDVTGFLPLKYLLYFGLFLTVFIVAFAKRNMLVKKKTVELKPSPQEIRRAALDKLELLEHQMANNISANNHIADMIFDILKDFLQQVFTSKQFTGTESELLKNINSLPIEKREKELITDVLNTSLNTRFSIQDNSPLITVYLDKVKSLILCFAWHSPIEI
jgi:hypothetical protein